MTKKELLEAIEDMPMDAEIYLSTGYRDSNIRVVELSTRFPEVTFENSPMEVELVLKK